MTVLLIPHVYCDGPEGDCPFGGEAATEWREREFSKARLNADLRERGWRIRGTKHYCPDCATRMPATRKGKKA